MTCKQDNHPYASSHHQLAELAKRLEILQIDHHQAQGLFDRAEDAVTSEYVRMFETNSTKV